MGDEIDLESRGVATGSSGDEPVDRISSEVANANAGGDVASVVLSWENLRVTVNSDKVIMHDVSGIAEPGQLVAIMGPSGSGKSTLLDTLAGRQSRNAIVDGKIRVNGHKTKLSHGYAAYLAQDAMLLGTLTVFETLYYSAKFRFPDHVTEQETRRLVSVALEEVGLTEAANTPIGTWFKRGISGGEKRRVGIAIELLTSPHLIFLDEPTSGLDSASSFHVISTLKSLAQDGGRTILCSIHQPSSEVFELFDNLCLLSDGRQVYFGPVLEALEFFEKNGFPCPRLRSPSDHFLHCVNSDFDKHRVLEKQLSSRSGAHSTMIVTSAKHAVAKLTKAYAESEQKKIIDEKVERASTMKGQMLSQKGSQASFLKQSTYLTMRSFLNMHRDPGYYWMRAIMYGVLAVAVSTVFINIGHTYSSIQARASFAAFMVGFMSFMAIGGFPSFIEDMKVFFTERMNGHYRVAAYAIANSLSSIPFILMISLITTVIAYPTVKLHSGADRVVYFLLDVWACLLVSEAIMMTVSSCISNFLLGIMLGAGTSGIYLLVSGFFRLRHDIPKPIWTYPIHYMGYLSYGFQGMLKNEAHGSTFLGRNPGDPIITAHEALREYYQVNITRSKWLDLVIVFSMAVIYRILFGILLKGRENVFPAIADYFSKKYRDHIATPSQKVLHGSTHSLPNGKAAMVDDEEASPNGVVVAV